jgi:AcrR family transcriptional regulator
MLTPAPALLQSIRRAFHQHGFAGVTMVDIARECGFTRRALYHYFSNKEDAFRAVVRAENVTAMREGLAAGEVVRAAGGGAVDVVAAIMDRRYGNTRRFVEVSPHTVELNSIAFMLCRDIMIEAAVAFQRDLAALIAELVANGRMTLKPGFTLEEVAQTLSNGARGVNQALPPGDLDDLARRYRSMCRMILFGCAAE